MDRKNKKIAELVAEIENKEIENNNRFDSLMDSKKEMERHNNEKITAAIQAHNIGMERRKQDYRDKQDAD